MNFRAVRIALLFFSCAFFAYAQHDQGGSGYWPIYYHGDNWTGTISSFDQASDSITLTYEHKGKVESFTGVLKKPVALVDKDNKQLSGHTPLKIGDRITVYYYTPSKGNINMIIEIKVLDTQKH
jgi:hypothetical protein